MLFDTSVELIFRVSILIPSAFTGDLTSPGIPDHTIFKYRVMIDNAEKLSAACSDVGAVTHLCL